jgi:transcriptional regulator of met regulon
MAGQGYNKATLPTNLSSVLVADYTTHKKKTEHIYHIKVSKNSTHLRVLSSKITRLQTLSRF